MGRPFSGYNCPEKGCIAIVGNCIEVSRAENTQGALKLHRDSNPLASYDYTKRCPYFRWLKTGFDKRIVDISCGLEKKSKPSA